jgi:hypothetical protein
MDDDFAGKRAIIVARVSTPATISLDRQVEQATDWACAHDVNVVAVLRDTVPAHATLADRPNAGAWVTAPDLMAQYELIIATAPSRLADERALAGLLDWAHDEGKTIVTTDGAVSTARPNPGAS